MPILETKHKRKSAVITTIILTLIIFGIINSGIKYLDPPEEYGLVINFGTTNYSSGNTVEKTKVKPIPKQQIERVEKKPEIVTTPKNVIKEDIISQETKDAPTINKPDKVAEKDKPKEKIMPKPSKETQDALDNLLKGNSANKKPKGEGDGEQSDIKGKEKGNVKSNKYYGNIGSGGDSNYNLAGRKALLKPIEKPNCNEEGIVVVSIEVDKKGRVIKAIPGVKGSTNTAPCLLKPAKSAALKTEWNADKNAPIKQKGTIIYKFSLSK